MRQDLADILEEGPSARSTTNPTRSFSKVAEDGDMKGSWAELVTIKFHVIWGDLHSGW